MTGLRRESFLIPAALLAAAYLASSAVLRAVLAAAYWDQLPHSLPSLLRLFSMGLMEDALVALLLSFPLAALGLASPRWPRAALGLAAAFLFAGLSAALFLVPCEFFFFQEFNSRFNYIAVDYLDNPQEVVNMVREDYPYKTVFSLVFLGAGGLSLLPLRWMGSTRLSLPGARLGGLLAVWASLALAVALRCALLPPGNATDNALSNEIAGNGPRDFAYSAYTHEVDYDRHYRTLPEDEAFARARARLAGPGASPLAGPGFPRRVAPHAPARKANIVLTMEESFSSEFVGCLTGNPEDLTPEFDALAKRSLLFTRLYATGTRTVRGFEGVLASFPPIPGQSIVKRTRSDDVFTWARALKAQGYDTLFIYGGRGVFDNMRRFMTSNGFDRFIEQKDFVSPTHVTTWGVCDEDAFHRAIAELDRRPRGGRPLFLVLMTVSNHKPYTYPEGRIVRRAPYVGRGGAVRYADWAIGDFIRRSAERPFYAHTMFAFVADHGARVYGADFFPIKSYEIPLLVHAPGLGVKPGRVDTLGGSLDVMPTLLGLLGLGYDTAGYGRDLLSLPKGAGQALLQHDRDVALMRGERLAVLGQGKSAALFDYRRGRESFSRLDRPKAEDVELLRDCMGLYQSAAHLYRDRRYRLP